MAEESRIVKGSISTKTQNVELKMLGIHPIYGADVEGLSNKLALTVDENREVVLGVSQHCKKLLDRSTKLKSFQDMISTGYDRYEELTETPEKVEQQGSDSTTQSRVEIQSLLSRLFEVNILILPPCQNDR